MERVLIGEYALIVESKNNDTQISRQSDNLDQREIRNRDNVKTVRDIISSFETRMNSKIDFLDTKIDNLETELDEKIKLNLSNPLTQ